MSPKSKIILIFIIIVIIILAILYFFVYKKPSIPETINEEEVTQEQPIKTEVPIKEQSVVVDEATKEKAEIIQMASSFIERFGSYSNQSDYENIESLKPLMTNKMKIWADNFIREQKAKQKSGEPYWGITTRVISAKLEVVDLEKGEAIADISTQCHESSDAEARVYYQKAVLRIIKENGTWKIDQLVWE